MNVYMKVPGNSLELPDKLSSFVVSPPKGGEMGVYMKGLSDSLGLPSPIFIFCGPSQVGWAGCSLERLLPSQKNFDTQNRQCEKTGNNFLQLTGVRSS
ncbi:MAG: hypothetical protein D3910_21615 [Candidatus Electrothrix sp. ATG2]|nr:hypothetical protein [Candidatus Electrothrix sp. ATG2]